MLSQSVNAQYSKLPTARQYLKENPQEQGKVWNVDKILWGDKFRTITFFTECFRMSFKFNDDEEYRLGISEVLDPMPYRNGHLFGDWKLELTNIEKAVLSATVEVNPGAETTTWIQFGWGLVTTGKALYEVKQAKRRSKKQSDVPA
jgi:hypothetical protein